MEFLESGSFGRRGVVDIDHVIVPFKPDIILVVVGFVALDEQFGQLLF